MKPIMLKKMSVGVSTLTLAFAATSLLSSCDTGEDPAHTVGYLQLAIFDQDEEPLRGESHGVHFAPYWNPCDGILATYPFDTESGFLHEMFPDRDIYDGTERPIQINGGIDEGLVQCLVFAVGPLPQEVGQTFDPDTVFAESVTLQLWYPDRHEPDTIAVSVQL